MSRRSTRPALVLATLGLAAVATPAVSADLPARSRLGEVFATPVVERPLAYEADVVVMSETWIHRSPPVPGYYGRAGDFTYRSYYGTPPLDIYGRLPYACRFFGC